MIRPAFLAALLPLFLLSCKPRQEEPPTPLADSLAISDSARAQDSSTSADATPARTDSASEAFDRIPTARIDSLLTHYKGGDTISIDSIGQNECIGERLNRYVLRNGLVLEGNTYNMYATDWSFQGSFAPVLGLTPGMTEAEVEHILGRPFARAKDSLTYKSERFEGQEAEIFENRWNVLVRFGGGKLKSLLFTPMFDDC